MIWTTAYRRAEMHKYLSLGAGARVLLTAAVLALLHGCVALPTSHRVESSSLAVEYVAEHDRIISIEPANGANLLKRVNFALRRHAKGKDSLIGGMHVQYLTAGEPTSGAGGESCGCGHAAHACAEAPATVWDWDSSLGRAYVSMLTGSSFEATSLPATEGGAGALRWQEGVNLDQESGTASAWYTVVNDGDEAVSLRLARVATLGRNAVIWIPVPAEGMAITVEGPDGVATWDQILKQRGRWLEIPAGGRSWKGKRRNTISARVPTSAPVIAVWTQNYWFVRVLTSGDGPLSASDGMVDLRFDHSAWLFHARLVGPEVNPGQGESASHTERWYVIWSPRMDISAVDTVLDSAGITWEAPFVPEPLEPMDKEATTQSEPVDLEDAPSADEQDSDADDESVKELIDIEDIIDG